MRWAQYWTGEQDFAWGSRAAGWVEKPTLQRRVTSYGVAIRNDDKHHPCTE